MSIRGGTHGGWAKNVAFGARAGKCIQQPATPVAATRTLHAPRAGQRRTVSYPVPQPHTRADPVMSDPAHRPYDTEAVSPAELLDEWRELVDACVDGYEDNVMQYHADLAIRDRIEACLRAPGRTDAEFDAHVADADARFRALLQPGVEVGPAGDPWWHRGVPRYAGDALADDVQEWFGVEVERRESGG